MVELFLLCTPMLTGMHDLLITSPTWPLNTVSPCLLTITTYAQCSSFCSRVCQLSFKMRTSTGQDLFLLKYFSQRGLLGAHLEGSLPSQSLCPRGYFYCLHITYCLKLSYFLFYCLSPSNKMCLFAVIIPSTPVCAHIQYLVGKD